MMQFKRLALLAWLGFAGCDTDHDGAAQSARTRSGNATSVTVSVPNPVAEKPLPDGVVRSPVTVVPNDDAAASRELDDERLRKIRNLKASLAAGDDASNGKFDRQGCLRIIELATQLIAETAHDDHQERLFEAAVVELLEARRNLALNGDASDIQQLYRDVESLNSADPSSASAAEGLHCLAVFAHTMARQSSESSERWPLEAGRWSREFAQRFPQDQERAVTLLYVAGRSNELRSISATATSSGQSMRAEAKRCYEMLVQRFPHSEAARDAATSLRRFALPGQQLNQFAGPTLDGGFVSAESFIGTATVLYFWNSTSPDFQSDFLPALKALEAAAGDNIQFVGISLDQERAAVKKSCVQHALPGRQIFFPSADQRGWGNPLVRFWGISHSETAWFLDADGIAVDVDLTGPELALMAKRWRTR